METTLNGEFVSSPARSRLRTAFTKVKDAVMAVVSPVVRAIRKVVHFVMVPVKAVAYAAGFVTLVIASTAVFTVLAILLAVVIMVATILATIAKLLMGVLLLLHLPDLYFRAGRDGVEADLALYRARWYPHNFFGRPTMKLTDEQIARWMDAKNNPQPTPPPNGKVDGQVRNPNSNRRRKPRKATPQPA